MHCYLCRASVFAGEPHEPQTIDSNTRQLFRERLRNGELDDKEIEIEVSAGPVGVEIMAPPAWRK